MKQLLFLHDFPFAWSPKVGVRSKSFLLCLLMEVMALI